MSPQIYTTVALVSYLLGSIPFGYVLVKIFKRQDIRTSGSGNIGATNVARSGAKGLALATLTLDILKGLLALLFATAFCPFDGSPSACVTLMALAALFAILGHCFTVWLKFKGGKGVATAFGTFLVLTPKAALIALGVFLVTFALSRYVSLGSILAAIAVPVATYYFGMPMNAILLLTACNLVVIVKHHQNISRLVAGTENRWSKK